MDELIARHCDLKTTPTDVLRCRQLCQDCAATALRSANAEIARLREALDQLLDDMGENGLCVCEAAKDQARAALKGER